MTNNKEKIICRACLCDKRELLQPFLDKPDLMAMYMSCTYLEVNINDNLPKNLCSSCIEKCMAWNLFKEMCTDSELLLKNKLNYPNSVEIGVPTIRQTVNSTVKSVGIKPMTLKIEFEEVSIKNEIISMDNSMSSPNVFATSSEGAAENWESMIEIDTIFECDDCDEKFQNKSQILSHMRKQHVSIDKLDCPQSRKLFSNKLRLLQHKNRKTCKLRCEVCNETFKSISQLSQHSKKHSELQPPTQPHKCKICDNCFFKTKYLLTSHCKREHSQENLYSCDTCNESFTTKSSLRLHNRVHKLILCSQCGKTFNNKRKLRMHMFDHTNELPHKCQFCDKGFKVRSKCILHQRVHTGERPFPCTLCDKTYRSPTDLKQHYLTHTGIKPFKCDQCENSYYSSSNLKTHIRRQHTGEKPYVCKLCYNSFVTSTQLKQHSVIHSNDRPFQCDDCGKSYKRKLELIAHLKLHTGQAPKCTLCNKVFTKRTDLIIHMRRHTGEKPYGCTICDNVFDSQAKFKRHMKKHHDKGV